MFQIRRLKLDVLAKIALSLTAYVGMVGTCVSCADYSYLKNDKSNNIGEFSEHEMLLFSIDERVREEKSVRRIFNCLIEKNPKIFSFFGNQKYKEDFDIYQFAFAEFSYGGIFVSDYSYEQYILEDYANSTEVIKVTFDFDEGGLAYINNVFGIRAEGSNGKFFEFLNGEFVATTRCLSCHSSSAPFFFKSRFTGKIAE